MKVDQSELDDYFDRPLILVADDDLEMRRVLWERLTRAGYRVRAVADGAAALERIQIGLDLGPRCTPAAIVADLRMAPVDGVELLRRLRSLALDLPVIVITAFGEPEAHAVARELGAIASFDKPLPLATLVTLLHQVAPPPAAWTGST
jgi:CheY-like chemotaxis protein